LENAEEKMAENVIIDINQKTIDLAKPENNSIQ
jgi:hypothetical protein